MEGAHSPFGPSEFTKVFLSSWRARSTLGTLIKAGSLDRDDGRRLRGKGNTSFI